MIKLLQCIDDLEYGTKWLLLFFWVTSMLFSVYAVDSLVQAHPFPAPCTDIETSTTTQAQENNQ